MIFRHPFLHTNVLERESPTRVEKWVIGRITAIKNAPSRRRIIHSIALLIYIFFPVFTISCENADHRSRRSRGWSGCASIMGLMESAMRFKSTLSLVKSFPKRDEITATSMSLHARGLPRAYDPKRYTDCTGIPETESFFLKARVANSACRVVMRGFGAIQEIFERIEIVIE